MYIRKTHQPKHFKTRAGRITRQAELNAEIVMIGILVVVLGSLWLAIIFAK